MKKYSIKIAFILISLFTLSACNNNTSTTDHQEAEEEHQTEEALTAVIGVLFQGGVARFANRTDRPEPGQG